MIMKYNARSHWSMGVLSCEYVNTAVFPFFEKDFMKAIKDFFRVNEYERSYRGLEEFSKVIQTRAEVEVLNNCLEF